MANKYQRGNIGEKYKLSDGSIAIVIDGGSREGYCTILYNNEKSKKEVGIGNLRRGQIKNEYAPSVHNVGYTGIGEYTASKNGEDTKNYKTWQSMLGRCYDGKYQERNPTYIGINVCDEWHNFQNFAKWYEENYREFEGSRAELDKDFLGNGTLYSPSTCCFIPHKLNTFLCNINSNNTTGFIGVSFCHVKGKFVAKINDVKTCDKIHLGTFNSAKEAGRAYNNARAKQCEIMKDICINKWNITDKKILNNIK